ncbi:unnamed protein product (mitochondrion) [Plasmodiophora brassicae]|uniref:Uncharacterized protein n=1 Tax=Plasmodiophora brassicae TaxID=37360 RepID=A0A3P3XZG4_PLABS|nr:unnamed protein product [Plasmodiophora brassicae]
MRRRALLVIVAAAVVAVTPTKIDDCCCEMETVDLANQDQLHATLQRLRETRFFRIFQVNLDNECQFWQGYSMCHSPGCSVCECEDDDIPPLWKAGTELDTGLPSFRHWTEKDDSWIVQDTGNMTFIDLQRNPEGYTGYTGESARKVWAAMYGENCFQEDMSSMCYEKRVFYRLLSGMQACIAAHVSFNHPLGEGLEWGPEPHVFDRMLGNHPNRIQNMYFTYVFLLRAVNKVSPHLLNYDFHTGNNDAEDQRVDALLRALLASPMIQQCSPEHSFDERIMFQDLAMGSIKTQLKNHFRNLSLILDCVQCDKCKVHGKLQVLGLGTALKILFNNPQKLTRNEIIALINTLGKFSHGLWIVNEMQHLAKLSWTRVAIVVGVCTLAFWSACCLFIRLWIVRHRMKAKTD